MPFFLPPPRSASVLTAADLQALHQAVASLRDDVAAVRQSTEDQGRTLALLPATVLQRFEDEAASLASKLGSAVLKKAREELLSGAVKWGLRSVYGVVGAALTAWWTGLLGGLHK